MALPTLPDLGSLLPGLKGATGAAANPNLGVVPTNSKSTIRDLVDWAGWNGQEIDIMTAIVLAEGGSEIDKDGKVICRANFAGCCWGPFQINLAAWKVDKSLACDYKKAAKFSHDSIFKQQGFEAWEAYTNGSYKKFAGQNKSITLSDGNLGDKAVEAASGAASAVASLSPGSAIKGLVDIISKIFDPSTWLRFGKIIFGVVVFLIGAIALLNSTLGQTAMGKTAKSVATKGAL